MRITSQWIYLSFINGLFSRKQLQLFMRPLNQSESDSVCCIKSRNESQKEASSTLSCAFYCKCCYCSLKTRQEVRVCEALSHDATHSNIYCNFKFRFWVKTRISETSKWFYSSCDESLFKPAGTQRTFTPVLWCFPFLGNRRGLITEHEEGLHRESDLNIFW